MRNYNKNIIRQTTNKNVSRPKQPMANGSCLWFNYDDDGEDDDDYDDDDDDDDDYGEGDGYDYDENKSAHSFIIITEETDMPKTPSPMYCVNDNCENWCNL